MLVLIPMFSLHFSAAEEIDSRPENQPQVTRRMIKKATEQLNPPDRRVPSFLEGCSQGGKRSRNAGESMRVPFAPDWGICEQDSILGSTDLAVSWSRLSITAPDLLTVMAGDKVDEAERLGAQALYQVPTFTFDLLVCTFLRRCFANFSITGQCLSSICYSSRPSL